MGKTYVPKHKLLQKFTKMLFVHNPMQLNLEGNPGKENEYESEALSILSRFNESVLNLCEDAELQNELAEAIVREAFVFWFHDEKIHEPAKISAELIKAYSDSFPKREQIATAEVSLTP